MKYRAEVERDGRFWLVHIPEIDQYTQARNLREVEPMARDLIAVMQEVEPGSFEVEVSIQVPNEAKEHWERSRALHELADAIRSEAASEAAQAAHTLVDDGMTLREVGSVLDISFQRAGQLVAQRVAYSTPTDALCRKIYGSRQAALVIENGRIEVVVGDSESQITQSAG